MKTAIITA